MSAGQRNSRRTVANRTKAGLTLSAAVSGLLPLLFHANAVNAATTYTWDPGNMPGAPTGGSGVWDLGVTGDWATGGVDTTWGDSTGTNSNAVFGAPTGSAPAGQ